MTVALRGILALVLFASLFGCKTTGTQEGAALSDVSRPAQGVPYEDIFYRNRDNPHYICWSRCMAEPGNTVAPGKTSCQVMGAGSLKTIKRYLSQMPEEARDAFAALRAQAGPRELIIRSVKADGASTLNDLESKVVDHMIYNDVPEYQRFPFRAFNRRSTPAPYQHGFFRCDSYERLLASGDGQEGDTGGLNLQREQWQSKYLAVTNNTGEEVTYYVKAESYDRPRDRYTWTPVLSYIIPQGARNQTLTWNDWQVRGRRFQMWYRTASGESNLAYAPRSEGGGGQVLDIEPYASNEMQRYNVEIPYSDNRRAGDIDCAREIALICPPGQIDECALNFNGSHRCVADDREPGSGAVSEECMLEFALFCPPGQIDSCALDMSSQTRECVPDTRGDDDFNRVRRCQYNGRFYADGTSFPDVDGCNTCSCTNGLVACTEMACFPNNPGNNVCRAGGREYREGQTFPAADGCNTCTCSARGIFCTELACVDTRPEGCRYGNRRYAVGDRFPDHDGCNTCTCTERGIACTELACVPDPDEPGDDQRVVCQVGRVTYRPGDRFPAEDGCNTCGCDDEGRVFCTELACVDPEIETCQVGNRRFRPGDRWLDSDGCNTCTCNDWGVACTEIACGN